MNRENGKVPENYPQGEGQGNFIKVEGRVAKEVMTELGITDSQQFVDKYAQLLREIILGDEELRKAAEVNEPGVDEKVKKELLRRIKEQTG